MANGNVQRKLVTTFGADEDTVTDAPGTAVVLANSFAKLTNIANCSGGPDAGVSVARGVNDLSCLCLLTDVNEVTLTRPTGGENEDLAVAYEVIEFPGNGNDEVQVRMHEDIVMADTVGTFDTNILNVSDNTKLIPIVCGASNPGTGQTMDRLDVTVEIIAGPKIRLVRNDSADITTVSVAVLEMVGSNWTVEQNIKHTQAVANTVETENITSVDWNDTMIFSTSTSGSALNRSLHHAVWPDSGDGTKIKFNVGFAAVECIAHIATNANLVVESIDSIDGGETNINPSTDPDTIDKTINASTLADHFVVATTLSTSAGTFDERSVWNYYFTTTTNLRWFITRGSGASINWTAQLIDISGLIDSGSGTIITRTLQESFVMFDFIPFTLLSRSRSLGDSLQVTDAIQNPRENIRQMIESSEVVDETVTTYLTRKPGDQISVAEFVFVYAAFGRIVEDNFDVADSIVIMKHFDRVISETSKITDAIVLIRESFRQLADSLSVTDGFQKTITREAGFTINEKVLIENIDVVDGKNVAVSGIIVRQLLDTISINEMVELVSVKLLGESLSVIDSSDLIRIINRQLFLNLDPDIDDPLDDNTINVTDDIIVTRSSLTSTKIVLDSIAVNDDIIISLTVPIDSSFFHGIEAS